jgi:uncharacterized protein (UPF0276 family)
VRDEVWELYAQAVRRFDATSALIEWDDNIPEFEVLSATADKARAIHDSVMAERPRDAVRSELD